MNRKESAVTWIVLGLIILRMFMAVGLIYGYPFTPYHKGWYFHHGGDQDEYFFIAKMLIEKGAVASFRPFGYSLTLIPFILLYDAVSWKTILVPAVLFNAFYLFSLSAVLVALIAAASYKNKAAVILSTTLWVVLPYFIWWGTEWILGMRHPDRLGSPGPEIWMVHQMWVQMLSDPLATFLCILIFFLLIRDAGRDKGAALPLFIGVLVAYAMSVRYPNIVLLPAGLLVYLAHRKYRKMLWFFISLLAVLLPMLIYHLFRGLNPLSLIDYQGVTSHTYGALKWIYLPLTIRYLMEVLPYPAFIAICALLLVTLWGLFRIFAHNAKAGTAILLWILFYSLFFLSYDGLFRDPFRFLMPVYPPVIICVSVSITDLIERLIRRFKIRGG